MTEEIFAMQGYQPQAFSLPESAPKCNALFF